MCKSALVSRVPAAEHQTQRASACRPTCDFACVPLTCCVTSSLMTFLCCVICAWTSAPWSCSVP